MKKKHLILWLALGALCLGACGPRNDGGRQTKTAVEKENGEEKPGEETEDIQGESEGSEKETKPSGEEDTKGPRILSLVTVPEYDYVWETGHKFCHTSYSKIQLDNRAEADTESGASAFPELAEALSDMNAQTVKAAGETLTELEAAAREMEADGFDQELFWEENIWVVRADSQVLSLLRRDYMYSGGAHGDYGYTGITFDTKSGRQIKMEEIVADSESLIELAADHLAEKYPDIGFFEDPREIMERELEEGYLTWVAGYQGITFFFDPYELAPYGYGTLTATVLYKEAPELFEAEIRQVPGSWAVQIASGMEFDLGHDGTLDKVEISGIMDEYGNAYEKLQVSVNGRETERDMWFYQYNSYLVHKENLDTELLVTETTSESDYRGMLIHELDPDRGGFQNPWHFSGTSLSTYFNTLEDGTEEYGSWILTDPEHFSLSTRYDLLSTYYGSQWCGIDETAREGGYLTLDHPWMDVDRGEYCLTLRVPLEMESGEAREPKVYPAGTKLWIIRVEADNCVVLRTEDQEICRVYVESLEWPGKVRGVEGMNIDDIFDGVIFVG